MQIQAVRLPLLVFVGRNVREVRTDAGWSQRELSRRSGVPQAEICRIECGRAEDLRIGSIDRLFRALGIRYWLQIDAPRAIRPQTDLVHARCSAYVTRRLTASGWLVEREVEIGNDRGRGWIDILVFHPGLGILLVIEVKPEIHDIGEIERTMNWYQREAPRAAQRFGWRATVVTSALLVLQSQANDDLIVRSSDVFRTAFPGRARMLEAVVAGAGQRIDQRHVAMIDPRSRRSGWLRSTRSDGRRSTSPYVDYIDAARLLDPSVVGRRRC